MTRVAALLSLLFLASCGPMTDQRWEGTATSCTDNVPDFDVIMLLNRVGSDIPGWAGSKLSGSKANYYLGQISDLKQTGSNLTFSVDFDQGSVTNTWEVDLDNKGSKWSGEIKQKVGSNTTRCDVDLEAVN